MSLMALFRAKEKGAGIAKERLKIIVAHQRLKRSNQKDYLPDLKRDILNVVLSYVKVESKDIDIKVQTKTNFSSLEINIQLPA